MIYNDELIVVFLFNIVIPGTLNELLIDVLLFNIIDPETFNELLIEVVFKIVKTETLNVDKIVALFDVELYALISYTPELFIILLIIY
jgi:hypothetical protein